MPSVELRPDQVEDLAQHIVNPRHLMAHDPGVGKTPIACLLAWYHNDERQKKTVWVQPKSLLRKNYREMLKFTDFAPEEVVILTDDNKPLTADWDGPVMGRIKTVRSPVVRVVETGDEIVAYFLRPHLLVEKIEHGYRKLGTKTAVFSEVPDGAILVERVEQWDTKKKAMVPAVQIIEEPEQVADLIAASAGAKVILCGFRFWTRHWRRVLAAHPEIDLMLVDESHMAYGGNDSQNTLELYESMRHIKHFAPMTATLIDGRLDTAFPVIHLIEPRYYGSYQGFLDQHAGYINRYGKVTYWVNQEKLRTILARHSTRRTFKDIYGPEAVVLFPPELVDMSPTQRAKYDEFHNLAMLELDDERILDGAQPGVAVVRARQIMAHPETFGIGVGEVTGKDEWLKTNIRHGEKALLFSSLIPEQRRLKALLESMGRSVGLVTGETSDKVRDQSDLGFKAGTIDDIVASPATASVGYNWPEADIAVFVSCDYKDTSIFQAYRRGLRGARAKPLRVYFLQYEDSIDQRILKILISKSMVANSVDETREVLAFAEAVA